MKIDDSGRGHYCANATHLEGIQVLGEGIFRSMDEHKTKLNNNVVILGASGSGKTSLIQANLYQCHGSYIVSDPKGTLYPKFSTYLRNHGYRVEQINFKALSCSKSGHYNPFSYIRSVKDSLSFAHLLANIDKNTIDPFWDRASELLLSACIEYLRSECIVEMKTLHNLISLLIMAEPSEDGLSQLDLVFKRLDKDSWCLRQYRRFKAIGNKTLLSVLITLNSKMVDLDLPEIENITKNDTCCFERIGEEKTAIFFSCSETDRSMDTLASIFFTQCLQNVMRHADEKCGGRLPLPVRFFIDDLANGIFIPELPRMLSSIRSRNISATITLQSKGQLDQYYGANAETVLSNADRTVYLGGNDISTARLIAEKGNMSLAQVLNLPIGNSFVFERGQKTIIARNFDVRRHREEFLENGILLDDELSATKEKDKAVERKKVFRIFKKKDELELYEKHQN